MADRTPASGTGGIAIPTYPDLAGKVAVVTGGSRGIGAATCGMLAANGVRVVVSGRDPSAIQRTVTGIRDRGGDAVGVGADCTNLETIDELRAEAERVFGPADILVAYAGGFRSYTPVHAIEEEEWRQIIDVNLTATFLTIKSFLPGMIERRRGSIVTMASNAGRLLDVPLTAPYAAAKAGIVMFTRHVANEVGRYGVRANCIAPATVLTERVDRIMPRTLRDVIVDRTPLGRLGEPEDVALATLFLVSGSSSWLTGVTLDVAGGRIML